MRFRIRMVTQGVLAVAILLVLAGSVRAQVAGSASKQATPAAQSARIRRLLSAAHALQLQYRDSEALADYEEVLRQDSKNFEALWQSALLNLRIGSRYSDETRKSLYFTAARGYAERSWALQPETAESNYAVALALASQATLLHATGRLQTYKAMKPYVFKAVARRPTWADAWQLLGRWHYRVDNYNVLERVYSTLFLGGVPSGATTRQATDALLRARDLEPKRIQVYYDLARVYAHQHKNEKAVSVLQKAILLTPVTTEELEISRRCRNYLSKLQRKMPAVADTTTH